MERVGKTRKDSGVEPDDRAKCRPIVIRRDVSIQKSAPKDGSHVGIVSLPKQNETSNVPNAHDARVEEPNATTQSPTS